MCCSCSFFHTIRLSPTLISTPCTLSFHLSLSLSLCLSLSLSLALSLSPPPPPLSLSLARSVPAVEKQKYQQ
ncbi:unnamed protein product [Arctogadus glacialis]